jgi:hypothetical protein
MSKNFKNFVAVFLIYLLNMNYVYSANITGLNTINSDSTTQQVYNGDNTSLTITNSATLSRSGQAPVNINEKSNATLTINAGSSITATSHNTVQGKDQTGLTVTNSGTISSGGSKAINLLNAQNSTVTNNSGGIIKSNTNTITLTENSGTGNNVTITNSGQIFAEAESSGETNNNAIKSEDDTNNMTLINKIGGHIYNNNSSETALQQATVFIAAEDTATLTNSGTIENKAGPGNYAIRIAGNGVTVTLKDSGKIIGKINVADSGHTIKLQHGAGQGYYYDIDGNGNYTLEDLDGNPVVKGSAGSVGQAGNEMLDEVLGYKTLSTIKSLNRFKKNKENSKQDKAWGEITTSLLKRKQDNETLRLGSETLAFTANVITPTSQGKNFIVSFNTGSQNINRDHDINKFGFLTGLHFDKIKFRNTDTEVFMLGGVDLNSSNRKILTNTTSTGVLEILDNYHNYSFLIGSKFNTNPDISFNFGHSYTPSHEEDKYFEWDKKEIYNGSISLSDEYELIKNNNSNLYLSWIADSRIVLHDNTQVFRVNGTRGTYSQKDELKKEVSLSASLNYEYKFSKNNIFSLAFDGLRTSQEISGIQAGLNYKYKF